MIVKKRAKKGGKISKADKLPKDSCFTIMPFGGWFDRYYSDIYLPAIKSAGLSPKRADDLYRPGTIINDIWLYTQNARIVLADLTGKNPNVFYELGLAHALAKPAILVAESIDDIPFDLRALRIIEYNKNAPDWGEHLKVKITNSIKELIGSPLESVLPAFLDVKSISRPSVTQYEKELLELKQDIELLRREFRKPKSNTLGVLSSEEVDEIIHSYLEQGLSIEAILKRLENTGVDTTPVIQRIFELESEKGREKFKALSVLS